MIIAVVGFGLLGLPRGVFSGLAAVGWISAYIVAAHSGGATGGPVEKSG
jgi:hypothetical protein